jgi:hypothetical protein
MFVHGDGHLRLRPLLLARGGAAPMCHCPFAGATPRGYALSLSLIAAWCALSAVLARTLSLTPQLHRRHWTAGGQAATAPWGNLRASAASSSSSPPAVQVRASSSSSGSYPLGCRVWGAVVSLPCPQLFLDFECKAVGLKCVCVCVCVVCVGVCVCG